MNPNDGMLELLKKGWKLKVEKDESNRILVSHAGLSKNRWCPKSWVEKGHLVKRSESPSTQTSATPSERFSQLEAALQKSRKEIELKKNLEAESQPQSTKPPKDDEIEVPLNIKPIVNEDENLRLFMNNMETVTLTQTDTAFEKYILKKGYNVSEAQNLQELEIRLDSWEQMENAEPLNDEIARALLTILAAKLKDMNLQMNGFQDPQYHGAKLGKRRRDVFRANNTIATANIFNDGESGYVCAIQQNPNTLTYCNSQNPGEKPDKYVLDQMKETFDLSYASGTFKILSLRCQRQDRKYKDSLLWAIMNTYIVLKGHDIATVKLKENTLRDHGKRMLVTSKWVTLMKKDINKRGEPEVYIIPARPRG